MKNIDDVMDEKSDPKKGEDKTNLSEEDSDKTVKESPDETTRTEEDKDQSKKRKVPPGSICPFMRRMCIRESCALWVGSIPAGEDGEVIQVNRCGFVWNNQLQMNMNQLVALLYGERAEVGEDDDIINDAFNEIIEGSDESSEEEETKLDLDF